MQATKTTYRKTQGNNFHEREPDVPLSRDRLLIIILHGICRTSEQDYSNEFDGEKESSAYISPLNIVYVVKLAEN